MREVKSVTFTKELNDEERDFTATIGASLTVEASLHNQSRSFGTVGDIRKIDDEKAEVLMMGGSPSPWGGDRFEVEYTSIAYKD